jgi:hypothetical protein
MFPPPHPIQEAVPRVQWVHKEKSVSPEPHTLFPAHRFRHCLCFRNQLLRQPVDHDCSGWQRAWEAGAIFGQCPGYSPNTENGPFHMPSVGQPSLSKLDLSIATLIA